jgi:glucose-6-phosphate dehydrogenase assembly protein OpcA
MIVEMPNTTTAKVSKNLVNLREEGGAVALGRVLTLVISTTPGYEEEAITAANDASREHPMRVIVLSIPEESTNITNRLDAEIRVGGDAGASEVIVLRAYGEVGSDEQGLVTSLLLPDAPVVVWWPGNSPAVASTSPLGRIAQCRITDAAAKEDGVAALKHLSQSYAPGDADFSWTRLTSWRTQLAAVLDQPPYEPITSGYVSAADGSPSARLLAAWLQLQLQVPIEYRESNRGEHDGSIHEVVLKRASGDIKLARVNSSVAHLEQPGQPRHDVTLMRRSLRDCLAEELRRLDPDVVYGSVITNGITGLGL